MISSKTFAIGSLVIAAGLSYLYNSSFSHDVVQVEKSSTISSVAAGVQVYYVDSVATGANDGSNWANAFIELQDALLIADACDTIKVAEGTYFPTGTPPVPMPDRTVSFVIPESVVVLGGYGRGADSLIRNWVCNKVILSGDIDHNGDTLNNSYHVVQTINVDSTTIVDGFCITGGNANGNGIDNSGGGGWFNNGSGAGNLSNPTIINCVLYANAGVIGGAMFNKGFDLGRSKPIMINCLLTGNNANYGGAMSNRTFNDILDLNRGTSSPILINCVLSGNYARFSGGAMYNVGANPILTNCILWNNDANSGLGSGPVFENYEAIPKVGYSILQGISMNDVSVTGGLGMTMDNGFNKFVDPFFINAPSAGLSTAGNFHLLIASPAIDMGDNSVNNYPNDLDGKARIINSTIDIGAYEFYINCDLYSGLTRIYVDSSAMGTNNGLTWDSAFTDLQDALAVVRSCGVDTILVAKGTYYPSDTLIIPNLCNDMVDIFEPNRSISFNIPESTVLLGGYPSGGQGLRNWVCNKTILSGDIDHNGDTLNNSYHVVQTINVDSTTIVDGFCITGGNANGNGIDNSGGGGWFNNGSGAGNLSNPTIINCVLYANAGVIGGAMFNKGFDLGRSKPIMINCLLTGNNANYGGAMSNRTFNDILDLNRGTSSPILINCVLSGNYARFSGGAMYNVGANPILTNCILWNNDANSGLGSGPVFENYEAIPKVGYSILQGISMNDVSVTGGVGMTMDNGFNKFVDPFFINAPSAGLSTAGNFHLLIASPAIDMGDNSVNNYPADLDGKVRIFNSTIDIGAYESADFVLCTVYGSLTRIYVDASATGANNGLTWDSAFTDLQDALAVVRSCGVDTILVAQGTYYPSDTLVNFDLCGIPINTVLPDQTISFNIPDSAVVLGGYPSGGNGPRDWVCNKTILCGDIQQDGDSSNNSYHVVTTTQVSSETLFDGFCITNGNANGIGFHDNVGGGWYNNGYGAGSESNPTIVNCIFTGNEAFLGGGMYNFGSDLGNSSPVLINCIVSNNRASGIGSRGGLGGGMFNDGFSGNSSPQFTNCIIRGNQANVGGGLFNGGFGGKSNPVLINCILSGNRAIVFGGGGGIYNDDDAKPTLVNSITWNNSSAFQGTGTIILSYSISQTGAVYIDGGNNKPDGTDPLFMFAPPFTAAPTAAGNFHVMDGSPAINMGKNAANTYPIDLDGLPRILGGIIDIGAYEKLIRCDNGYDTLYVNEDGTVPSLPVDSFLGDTLPDGFILLINGVSFADTDSIIFDCENLMDNFFDLLLIRNCDTIDACSKLIVILDTFPKNLVCNDLVNVSLGNGCLKVITPDDVLKFVQGCREVLYDINLVYPFGTHRFPPTNDLLDASHIGYTFVYNAVEALTGNSCWGYIHVEDKLPPLLNCRDTTIPCYVLPTLPLLAANTDDCNEGKVELISEEWFDYGCDSVLSGYVIRTIQGADRWGNFRRCTSRISILRTVLDSVVCPEIVALPCEIRYQIGHSGQPLIHPLSLVTPITVDLTKVTPAFLLSLQKPIWDVFDPTIMPKKVVKSWVLFPDVQVVPQIDSQNIWPGAGGICKINTLYKDTKLDICGAGFKIYREWTIVNWCTLEERTCVQYINVEDKEAPQIIGSLSPLVYNASAHECVASVTIPALIAGISYRDCNLVDQTYSIQYDEPGHPGKKVVLNETLPSAKLTLPVGEYKVEITLTDQCQNRSLTSRLIYIYDITPPTPVCDEFTQVTVDPEGCWSKIAAKDLDNGSRDNCVSQLHFAAAKMSDIEKARSDYFKRIVDSCGNTEYWANKAWYDQYIEQWINCYVFSDTIHFDECGSNQVVLRVYEADSSPRLDPHLWKCGEHAWFCYNTYPNYRVVHNWNFFSTSTTPTKDCKATAPRMCKSSNDIWFVTRAAFNASMYIGANPSYNLPINHLYADCMVNVLVDDKQAPVAADLEDITIYCDGAPVWADHPRVCDNGYKDGKWPGELKDSKGNVYGYYGGSDFLGIHPNGNDHDDPQACASAQGWAPIYCRQWLLLDSTDQAGHVDYKSYFDHLVLFDKDSVQKESLDENQFSITDNCILDKTSLKVTDVGTISGCGEGWISRTWTIKDKCGNPVSATQKIYVKHRSDFEVIFPEDKIVTCDFLNRTDTSKMGAGAPMISDDECEQIGVRYNDEIFTVEDGACYKIVRTWTLVDWCIYLPTGQAGDPNQHNHLPDVIVNDSLRANKTDRSCVYRNIKDNNDGYMQYVQIIKVIDDIPPVVSCEDYTICIDKDCSVLVNIPLTGTDNCADQLVFRIDITRPDNTHDIRSNVTSIAGTFTEGVYKVQIIGKDRCGNEDTCHMNLTINDCKKPTPYCLDALATVIMPSTGTVEIWAKDFNRASTDNCTAEADLKYSFSSDVTKASQVITCADMTVDGRIQLITLDVYVTDKAGNQDLCRISLQVQDNGSASQPQGACRDTSASLGNLTGILKTEELEGVENATIQIIPMTIGTNAIPAFKSGIDGRYQFGSIAINESYTIKAIRDDETMNGVSTLDLVNIQKHILGIERLKSPYKMIAADVNNDHDISVIDLLELRKLILGIYDKLPDNTSWKFVPKSYVFPDINSPWSYPTEESLTHMESNMVKDFVGIKIGDVNASAFPHSLMGTEIRNTETGLIFEVEDQIFHAGEQVKVEFRSPNFAGISGFQGTINFTNDHLRFDNLSAVPSIEKSSIVNNKINITDKNIGKRWANEGQITMSWNSDKSVDVDAKSVLFTMTFTASKTGSLSEVLRIGSQHTIAESYEGKGPQDGEHGLAQELGNLSIRFVKNGKEVAGTNTLYQNYPNPFDQRTVIGINLTQPTMGQLKITDVTGRTIKSIDRDWNKGYNEVWLDRREIGATGVLYYSFESRGFNAVKKMVILE